MIGSLKLHAASVFLARKLLAACAVAMASAACAARRALVLRVAASAAELRRACEGLCLLFIFFLINE